MWVMRQALYNLSHVQCETFSCCNGLGRKKLGHYDIRLLKIFVHKH